jgi:ABC-type polysaccharide/polyol phosphate export permease
MGLHVASLAARYQDIHGIMAVVYTILGYATPIIYPLTITKGMVRQVLNLNPLTNFVELIRGLAIDKSYVPSLNLILYSVLISLFIFFTGVIRARKSYSVIVEGL